MFNRKLKKRIKEIEDILKTSFSEVEFLRIQNKELHDRLLSYADQSFRNYSSLQTQQQPLNPPSWIDPLGHIQSMDAVTEEDKKNKKDAIKQIKDVIGAC